MRLEKKIEEELNKPNAVEDDLHEAYIAERESHPSILNHWMCTRCTLNEFFGGNTLLP